MMGVDLEVGQVVASYSHGMSVDVLMEKGGRLSNVQVMVGSGSDCTGAVDLPDVGGPADESRWLHSAKFARYVRAVIGFVSGVPVCIGFILPQETQMTFPDKNRRIMRHASDVYTSIDDAGNFELFHPSGTYLRIGSSPAHEDLTGKDFDGLWKIARNTDAAPHVHLGVSAAGNSVASLDFDPAGNVTLQNNGNLQATVGGKLEADVTGTTTVNSGGAAKVKAPSVLVDSPTTIFTGAVTIQGLLTFQAGASGSAGSSGGPTMTLEGDAHITGTLSADTDVLAANKSGAHHSHADPHGGDVGEPI